MSYIFYKILNMDLCIYIDKIVLYHYNYKKTLIELKNVFSISKKLIKNHNIEILERKYGKFNSIYYSNSEFINSIRRKNIILLILKIISRNYLI
jgi:hypothetical protein